MIWFMAILFVLGLLIGSFINVCIYRIPLDQSIVMPPSHCPKCNAGIRWYDNIPVVSYLLLRGRCRHCGTTISVQYPIIEFLTALSFLVVALRYPLQPVLPLYLYLTFVLITVSGIDYYHRIIPDVFSYSLFAIGLLYSPLNTVLGAHWQGRLLSSAIGAATGFGILYAIGYLGERVMGQEVMGGGDVKLLAGIGAIIGWSKVLSTLFIGSLIGSVLGLSFIAMKRMQRRDYLPFGPFLALAAFINLFLPDPWQWLNSVDITQFEVIKLLLDKIG